MANYSVTVGLNAQVFHDQSTGITIARGETVSLREAQFRSRRIQQALASGHLRLVSNEEKVENMSEADVAKLDKKIKAQFKKGLEISKIATSVNLDAAKKIAELNEVSIEEGDTVEDILKAVLED